MSTDQQTEETTRGGRGSQTPAAPVDVPTSSDEGSMPLDFSIVEQMAPVDERIGYLTVVTKFETGKSQSGNPTATVEVTVDQPAIFNGRKIQKIYSLQPQALFSMFNLLTALGISESDLKGGKFTLKPDDYVGLTCVTYVVNSEYLGQERSQPRRSVHASHWDQIQEEESAALQEITEETEKEAEEANF